MSDQVLTDPADDEDDWVDLEKSGPQAVAKAPISISLSFLGKPTLKARATASITFRGHAAEWIEENGPRFRVQVGGANCNMLRIVPDAEGGRFEEFDFHLVKRMLIGHVNLWPNEARSATEGTFSISGDVMTITLPADFARARTRP